MIHWWRPTHRFCRNGACMNSYEEDTFLHKPERLLINSDYVWTFDADSTLAQNFEAMKDVLPTLEGHVQLSIDTRPSRAAPCSSRADSTLFVPAARPADIDVHVRPMKHFPSGISAARTALLGEAPPSCRTQYRQWGVSLTRICRKKHNNSMECVKQNVQTLCSQRK